MQVIYRRRHNRRCCIQFHMYCECVINFFAVARYRTHTINTIMLYAYHHRMLYNINPCVRSVCTYTYTTQDKSGAVYWCGKRAAVANAFACRALTEFTYFRPQPNRRHKTVHTDRQKPHHTLSQASTPKSPNTTATLSRQCSTITATTRRICESSTLAQTFLNTIMKWHNTRVEHYNRMQSIAHKLWNKTERTTTRTPTIRHTLI